MDPFLLRDAHRVYADRGGREDGRLAARRLLDARLRQMVHWPNGQEYARVAEDMDADGRWADAALLRQIAATDHLLTDAQTHWNSRYATRPQTAGERDTRRLIDAGLIDFDPDGPYWGIDGSNYWPGYTSLETGPRQAPVVLVSGRGLWQLVTGFDDQAAVARWLHDRGPMASGPLTPPDVPTLPRAVLEEHILARMLCRPGDLPDSMASLPLTTFTADGRYDIYAAIITVARTGQRWNLEHVAAELGRRMDWVPEWALPSHGGQGTRGRRPTWAAWLTPNRWVTRYHACSPKTPRPGSSPPRRKLRRSSAPGRQDALRSYREAAAGSSTPPRLGRMRSRRPGARRSGPGQKARRHGCEHAIGSVIDRRGESA